RALRLPLPPRRLGARGGPDRQPQHLPARNPRLHPQHPPLGRRDHPRRAGPHQPHQEPPRLRRPLGRQRGQGPLHRRPRPHRGLGPRRVRRLPQRAARGVRDRRRARHGRPLSRPTQTASVMTTALFHMPRKSPRSERSGARPAGRPDAPAASDRSPGPLRYASDYHAPVLAREVVEGLVTDPNGVYVDGTLGGGGHSAALLDALGPGALVVGIDRDPEALAAATARLAAAAEAGRFRALRGNFADVERLLAGAGVGPVDGVLLDLGVSSHQLDEAARGFAFSAEGPLDMRMDPEAGEPASALLDRLDAQALADLLRAYGDEPRAWRIANAIVARRPVATTAAL